MNFELLLCSKFFGTLEREFPLYNMHNQTKYLNILSIKKQQQL